MQAVIFDMDGVLVDSNALHFQAFRALAQQENVSITDEMLQRTFGMHNREIMPMLLQRALSPSENAALAHRKEALYRELAVTGLHPINGAMALLEHLQRRKIPLAVGSSGPGANVQLGLRVLKMEHFFGCVITGDDVQRGKPDPEIFLKAAAGLHVKPEECVVIEDAPAGVTAAKAAGMRVYAVTTSCGAAELNHAHRVVAHLSQLHSEWP